MTLRVLPAVLATTLALSGLLVAEPALAAPAAPTFSALSTSTTGHVTGTVTTSALYVYVRINGDSWEDPILAVSGSAHVDLETWGWPGPLHLEAMACPAPSSDESICSPITASEWFTPSDIVPEVTWFDDDLIGPADPNPTISVADPGGGGVLKATYLHGGSWPAREVVVTPDTPTDVTGDLDRVSGSVQLSRCSASDFAHCATFTPDLQKNLNVMRHLDVSVGSSIPPMNSVSDSKFTLNVELNGPVVATWHLESAANPGVAVPGTDQVASRTSDSHGDMDPFTVPRVDIPEGSYSIVGSVDADNEYYGHFEDQPFSAALVVDRTPPAVTFSASRVLIYPNVNGTASLPSYVIWTITGPISDIGRAEVQKLDGTKVYDGFYVDDTSGTKATVTWNGKWADGKVRAGTYRFLVRDRNGNPKFAPKTITVDSRKLVLKKFIKTVTAGGSLKDLYVGRCSTLRKPSLRGWSYSLGLYANTKCSSQTSKDSVVNTIHAVKVPSAYSYVDVKVHTYGGAATGSPHSPAVLQYVTVHGDLVSRQRLTPTLMTHWGDMRSGTNMIFSDRYFAWSVYTGFGYRYDLKSFTVVVHYKVLV